MAGGERRANAALARDTSFQHLAAHLDARCLHLHRLLRKWSHKGERCMWTRDAAGVRRRRRLHHPEKQPLRPRGRAQKPPWLRPWHTSEGREAVTLSTRQTKNPPGSYMSYSTHLCPFWNEWNFRRKCYFYMYGGKALSAVTRLHPLHVYSRHVRTHSLCALSAGLHYVWHTKSRSASCDARGRRSGSEPDSNLGHGVACVSGCWPTLVSGCKTSKISKNQ